MQVSKSTEESVRLIASALGSLADTVAKMAGSLEELVSRVEHIEDFLESLEIEEEVIESTLPEHTALLPCAFEEDIEELSRWYAEGGPCYPQDDD